MAELGKPTKGQENIPEWYKESRAKGTSSTGNALFTILRFLDLPFQYYVLQSGLGLTAIHKLGGTTIAQSVTSPATAIGLSPYHSLVFGLAVGSFSKQIYWCLSASDNKFEPKLATFVALYNTILNTFNTLLTLWAVTSNRPAVADTWTELFTSRPSLTIGAAMYGVGLFTEWWCEVQRKSFKQDPANKGKLYTGGLFSMARNINYGGYTLWRSGYSIVCAGLPWGAAVAAWLAGDFAFRAIPLLEQYMQDKYGEQWLQVKKQVPYRLLPWIY